MPAHKQQQSGTKCLPGNRNSSSQVLNACPETDTVESGTKCLLRNSNNQVPNACPETETVAARYQMLAQKQQQSGTKCLPRNRNSSQVPNVCPETAAVRYQMLAEKPQQSGTTCLPRIRNSSSQYLPRNININNS